ncbi:MAG: efflux RND transporter periplasmic adaptor subunit [Bacteroidales bacterium]|nr:efflux RND transporter periplasmic adaptor subunit [Bacteroidales bacterium]
MKYGLILTSISLILASCSSKEKPEEERQQNILVEDRQQVTTEVAKKGQFALEIVSNGKITADKYADIYWEVSGTISEIFTNNGRHVQAGTTIAKLDAYKLKNQFESAQANLEQSKLNMKETIIGQGYNPDSTNIPDNIIKLAEIKSGYLQSLSSYNSTKYDYEHSTIKAPISGVVANLNDRVSNLTSNSKPFCRIIDQNSMCVEFTVIENELNMVTVGGKVEISAYSMPDKKWTGQIKEINPFVENNGMVRVKATVNNGSELFEGMNVSIKISKNAGEFISVPKSAVVLRSNRPVVFTAKDGLARWCYVETSIENSDNIAIISGIEAGDSVIVSGNTYLADKTEIIY